MKVDMILNKETKPIQNGNTNIHFLKLNKLHNTCDMLKAVNQIFTHSIDTQQKRTDRSAISLNLDKCYTQSEKKSKIEEFFEISLNF